MTNVRMPKACIIPIAGQATRMRPATYETPKHALLVGGKTLLMHAIEEAIDAGLEKIILITNPHIKENGQLSGDPKLIQSLKGRFIDGRKEKFKHNELMQQERKVLQNFLDISDDELATFSQKNDHDLSAFLDEKMKNKIVCIPQKVAEGLGHAVSLAANEISTNGEDVPFAVILPDEFIKNPNGDSALKQMVQDYKGGSSVATLELPYNEMSKYGAFEIKQKHIPRGTKSIEAIGMVEKSETPPSNYAAIGRYVLCSDVMKQLVKNVELGDAGRGSGNEFQLTDAIHQQADNSIIAYKYDGIPRMDCGNAMGYEDACRFTINQNFLDAGQDKTLTAAQVEQMEAVLAANKKRSTDCSKPFRWIATSVEVQYSR